MRRRMRAPINTNKHYSNIEDAPIALNGVRTFVIAQAVAEGSTIGPTTVSEGSVINSFFMELWLKSNEATNGGHCKFQFCIEKVSSGGDSINFTQLNNLHVYPNKKNILFYSQGVLGDDETPSIPVVRQWFKNPKSRIGLGDVLIATCSATTAAIESCGFITYKELK